MKLELAYNIANGGDGSASIDWYESSELADWYNDYSQGRGDERYMWGEPCNGTISTTSDSPMEANISVITAVNLYGKMVSDKYDQDLEAAAYLLENFLGGEKPVFTVKSTSFVYSNKRRFGMEILIGDEKVHAKYGISSEPTEADLRKLEDELNAIDLNE